MVVTRLRAKFRRHTLRRLGGVCLPDSQIYSK